MKYKYKKALVTGCAGFIGSNLVSKLLKSKNLRVFGIDNINNYYDTNLKKNRLKLLKNKKFKFYKLNIQNKKKILNNFKINKYDYIFHFAAQAGVRYSVENPQKYFDSNIQGYFNILEACKIHKPKILFFASSSSVYGDQKKMPLNEKLKTDEPKSFYAATKKCNEIMSYSYSKIYNLNIIGLRFFTVYGPFGRPDMTPYTFLNNYFKKKAIKVFNYGKHERDFTYIDDTISSILSLFKFFEKKKNLNSFFEIFNVARGKSEKLLKYLNYIESSMNSRFKKIFIKSQIGDVEKTFATTKKINKLIKYRPKYSLKYGVSRFVNWYKNYHKIKNL